MVQGMSRLCNEKEIWEDVYIGVNVCGRFYGWCRWSPDSNGHYQDFLKLIFIDQTCYYQLPNCRMVFMVQSSVDYEI